MAYTGLQRSLIIEAERYVNLGYKVGFANGKELIGSFDKNANQTYTTWDSISVILDNIVCVDFDAPFYTLGDEYPLPPTMKEKSPRGMHLFYRLPQQLKVSPKIKWQPDLDLLVNSAVDKWKATRYGSSSKGPTNWGGHVLVSPSKGYTRMYPTATPKADKLPMAPDWLLSELQK